MSQIVTDENGVKHVFPDEATPEMIAKALGVKTGPQFNQPTGELTATTNRAQVPPASGGSGIADDSASGSGFFGALRAGLAPDPNDQIRRFAARRFPNDPNAEKYYGFDQDGRIYYTDPNTGKSAYEVPAIGAGSGAVDTFMRAGDQLAYNLPSLAPQIAGGIAGAATQNPVVGTLTAGGVATITDAFRQGVDRLLAGENPLNIDPVNSLLQGAGAATGEGAGRLALKGVTSAYNRNPGRLGMGDVEAAMSDPGRAQTAADLAQYAKDRGTFLTLGESANLPGQLARERYLRTTPEGSQFLGAAAERMETAVPRIAGNTIGMTKSADTAIMDMRTAATDIMGAFRKSRSDAATPLYDEAYAANPSVMSKEISGILETPAGRDALKEAANLAANKQQLVGIPDAELGALARELADMGKMEYPTGGVASGLKLSTLDYIKRTLYAMGERSYAQGDRVNGQVFKNLANRLKNQLDQLDATAVRDKAGNIVSPGKYAQARQIFGDESSAVTESERLLQRFAEDTGAPLANKADAFFSAARTTPEEVAKARFLFAAKGKTEAWNDALSAWMADKYMAASARVGDNGNVARAFYKSLWGDERQRRVISAALGDSGKKLDDLSSMFEFLRAVGRQLPEGSSTGANMEAAKSVTAQAAPVIRRIARGFSPMDIGTAVADQATESAARGDIRKLIAIALKPENASTLKNLRMIGPKWQRSIPILTKLLNQAGLIPVRQSVHPSERQPAISTTP